MQQCPNGHLYDDEKNSSCPYCSNNNSINVTVPLSEPQPQPMPNFQPQAQGQMPEGNAFPQTIPLGGFNPQEYVAPQPEVAQPAADPFPQTAPIGNGFKPTEYYPGAENEKGIIEIRGWLVCLEGEKCGMDFKIVTGRNNIGRGANNAIKLDFDNTISKGVNATVSYDVRSNKFFIFLGESGKNNIYVNNQMLMTPVEIKDYDIIEIGNTKMIFRSLCNEQFNWTREEKEADK